MKWSVVNLKEHHDEAGVSLETLESKANESFGTANLTLFTGGSSFLLVIPLIL
jgi:hypothetical protein